MSHRTTKLFLLSLPLAVGIVFSGCSHSTRLYEWGQYESSIERMYADDGSFVLEREIDVLSQEIERAVERNRRIPPGKLAYLGYLYFQNGDTPLARESFLKEKTLFPESAVLMDLLIARLPTDAPKAKH